MNGCGPQHGLTLMDSMLVVLILCLALLCVAGCSCCGLCGGDDSCCGDCGGDKACSCEKCPASEKCGDCPKAGEATEPEKTE